MAIIGRHDALAAAVWVAGTAVWLGAIAAGTRVLVGHASTPGPVVRAAVQFPEDSGISRQTSRATLIIFAHPECPCTRATLGELSGLLAEVPSAPSVHVLFMQRDRASAATDTAARPGLILLDLNMPRKSGLEALREIKADPNLRSIPVVVLTTSKADEDILRSYDLGVNSFIVKPATFESLATLIKDLGRYWFEIIELPSRDGLLSVGR